MLPWKISADKTFLIAEIGQNHQGSLELAKEMITLAKRNGADCVKFQKTCLEAKFNKDYLNKPYNSINAWGDTYGAHKNYLEFTDAEFRQLQKHALQQQIAFSASAMDRISLEFLVSLRVPFIKIGSGDANNLLLIEEAAKTGIPLVISTGMQNLVDVKAIYQLVSKHHKKLCLMHCVSSYPTPVEQVNLNVIGQYRNEFPDIDIGYSGHELGIDITIAAVTLGAKVVERHFTLNKELKGSDHVCSLEPIAFRTMCEKIRLVEAACGQAIKSIQPCEQSCMHKLRKSIVVTRQLCAGDTLTLDDIAVKVAEPKGIDGIHHQAVIGRKLTRNLDADQSVTVDCLANFFIV